MSSSLSRLPSVPSVPGPLPATVSYPTAQRLSPGGQPFYDELVLVGTNGLPWRARLAGDPPAWTFTAIPTWANIAEDFPSWAVLERAVESWAALRTWGF